MTDAPTLQALDFSPATAAIERAAKALCQPAPYQALVYERESGMPMPSLEALGELVSRLRAAFFPGYYGSTRIHRSSLQYHIAANLDSIYRILREQILRGLLFSGEGNCQDCQDKRAVANEKALAFMQQLPGIRDLLASDVNAAYEGDPAAKSPGETIFCYPSILVMTNHRVAHCLYSLDVPLIPRIISEMAHSATGVDIHPGASIGPDFFIDHGTGVVIGETCIIGQGCRLYQGVTLGAVSFQKNDDGSLVKGRPRHPILEDKVTVYAGATILGRITIGTGSIIGGNVWLTHSVEANSRILQPKLVSTPLVSSPSE